MSLGYAVYKLMWGVIDWVFPPYCAGCKKFGSRWCDDCQSKTVEVSPNNCIYCDRSLPENRDCPYCEGINPNLDSVLAWGSHTGPLRQALHQLKYKRDLGLGEALSANLIELVRINQISVDMVVPVPLGSKRLRERGYNQASILARPVAMAFQAPFRPNALKRVKETRTQVGLSVRERRENMEGAFTANPAYVQGKTIILVDDVMTTGATLDAAASALKNAGANFIVGLTLAKAVKTYF